MKITDRPPPAVVRPPLSPRAYIAPGAFETLLRGDDQARGFGDLGMFGRRSEVVANSNIDVKPLNSPEPEVEPESEPETTAAFPQASMSPPLPETVGPLTAFAKALAEIAVGKTASASTATGQASIDIAQVVDHGPCVISHQIESEGETVKATGSAAPPPVATRVRLATGSGLNLVVTDQQRGLRVVITGLAITSPAIARLRLKVAELATEFGATLSELSLNGERLEVSTPLAFGGAHGDHAR